MLVFLVWYRKNCGKVVLKDNSNTVKEKRKVVVKKKDTVSTVGGLVKYGNRDKIVLREKRRGRAERCFDRNIKAPVFETNGGRREGSVDVRGCS